MATIAQENAKQYRQALDLYVSIEPELSDGNELASWNAASAQLYDGGTYNAKAGVLNRGNVTTLMDLSGQGFINDGSAQPIDTEQDGSKYGVLGVIADADGNLATPLTVTFTTSLALKNDTQLVWYMAGNRYTTPAAAGTSSISITINSVAEPYGRPIITRAKLGDIYEFTRSNILSLNVTLRGDTGYISPQLPISSLKLECYIPGSVASLVNFTTDTPVYYSAGYAGDMSAERMFYVSERITYSGRSYQVQAEDAVKWLDAEAYYTNTNAGTQKQAYEAAAVMVNKIVSGKLGGRANYTAYDLPAPRGNYWFFVGSEPARNIVARYMALLRTDAAHTLTYRDAGIPELHTQKITTNWPIDYGQIADLSESWDEQVTAIGFEVTTPYKGDEQEVFTLEGTNLDYLEYVNMGAPFVGLHHTFTPKRSNGDGVSIWKSNMYSFITHFKSLGGQGTATYYGTPILQKKAPIGNYAKGNPVYVSANGSETYGDYEEGNPITWGSWNSANNLMADGVPAYNAGARAMLARSLRTVSFKWRGNPHMQPWDKVTLNGTIYTLETITHEFKGGGFYSEITAREGNI